MNYNGGYRATRDREVEQIAKKWPQFGLQADNSPEKIGIASNRVSADVRECVPEPCTHRPSSHGNWEYPKSGGDEQTKETATESVITDNLDFSGKILLAEDSEGSQILVERILKRYGLEVVIVDDGKGAVEKARQESFDLILMDIQMPGLNGLEATRKLREEGITTPVVALTAYAMPDDRDKCMAAGCDDYISKPIDRDELRRVLSKYVAAETVSA